MEFLPFYFNYRHHPWKRDGNRLTTKPKVQRLTEELDRARRNAQQAIDRKKVDGVL